MPATQNSRRSLASNRSIPTSANTRRLLIRDIAFGGKGVASDNGRALFVPYVIDGETITARVIKERKQFAEAELLGVVEASPHRVRPQCPYFGRCGGCVYQHVSYEHQLTTKARQLEQALRRIAKIENPPMRPIIPSPTQYAYRNRVTVHAADGVIGYFRRDEHRLIDIERCPIASDEVNAQLAQLRARKPRAGHYALRADRGPRVFAQTNDAVAEQLARLAVELLDAGGNLLVDAYCGTGFFAKRLREKFHQVIGIEWDRYAVDVAQESADENERYVTGDVEIELNRLLANSNAPTTTIILDPPAEGLGPVTRRVLTRFGAKTVVYVSCNPPTLARDLRELKERYAIASVTPLDMFPQTAEIEAVAHLVAK